MKTEKNCLQEFARYASFNVLGMLGLSCYILADTYFISKGLGADGLTALNLAIPVYSMIHGCGLMAGMGGGTRYAIQKSLGDSGLTDRLFTNAVMLAGGLAILFVAIGVFGTNGITKLLGADASVYGMTRTYLRMILLFSPAFLMNNVLLCFVRNDGSPQRSMRAMLAGSLSNVILDYIFIFPCGMGIFGAVLATCLAPLISLLLLSPHLLKKENQFHFTRCKPEFQWIAAILASGVPSLVTELSSGIVMIVFNMLILFLRGNTGVAAYGIIANLSLVVVSIYTGIAQGMQPVISKHYGAGEPQSVRAALRYALVSMLAVSILIYAGIFFYADFVSAIFNKDKDQTLQNIAVEGLRLYFLSCPFAGFNIVFCAYFTSAARPLPANIISILRGFVIILPFAFLFSMVWGMTGIWCALPCTELFVAGIGILFFRKIQTAAACSY